MTFTSNLFLIGLLLWFLLIFYYFRNNKKDCQFLILVANILFYICGGAGADMTEYYLFLDEVKPNTFGTYFALGGYAISKQDYENILVPNLQKIVIVR